MKLGSLIFGLCIFGMACVFLGLEIGLRNAPERTTTLVKACQPKQQPNWICDAVERREYASVCLNRLKGRG